MQSNPHLPSPPLCGPLVVVVPIGIAIGAIGAIVAIGAIGIAELMSCNLVSLERRYTIVWLVNTASLAVSSRHCTGWTVWLSPRVTEGMDGSFAFEPNMVESRILFILEGHYFLTPNTYCYAISKMSHNLKDYVYNQKVREPITVTNHRNLVKKWAPEIPKTVTHTPSQSSDLQLLPRPKSLDFNKPMAPVEPVAGENADLEEGVSPTD